MTKITPELVREWLERWNTTSCQLALHELERELNKIDLVKAYLMLAEQREWHSMDSAPKDGAHILVYDGIDIREAWWSGDCDDFTSGQMDSSWMYVGLSKVATVRNWQQLPQPPGGAE